MVEHAYNGARASRNPHDIGVQPFVVNGVPFPGGVVSGEVAVILAHVLGEYHDRVEKLHKGWCWGWSYRKNRNANNLSVHSAGEAVDANAPKHPNGVRTSATFTPKQIFTCHQILREIPELDEVVHWGGDWTGTVDAMHWEIHDATDTAKIHRVYLRIKEHQMNILNPTQQVRVEVDKMLAYGERALAKGKAVPKKRVKVKAFLVTLDGALRVIRRAYPSMPKS